MLFRGIAIGVWGCCKERTFHIHVLVERIVTNNSFRVSAADLIKRLGWPTILCETATIMYKSTNILAPEYLSELFVQNSALTTMRLRNTKADLRVPLFKTSNRQKSISFRGPKLWNQLSSDVKLAPSLATFKRRLNKEILEG